MNTGFELRRFPEVTGLFTSAKTYASHTRATGSMVTIDQIKVPALQSAELLIRRMMVIREAHKVSPPAPDYSSADIRMGWQYRRSAQGVVTAMASYVAIELKNEAAILKESRKAWEEAQLRRKNPKNKKGGEGGGDQA